MPQGSALTLKWRAEPGLTYEGAEARIRAGAIKGLAAIGLVTTNHIKASIQRGGRGGIVYQKYAPRRTHTASAPGEFPATDTGRLVSSIGFDAGNNGDGFDASVILFASAVYAVPLELKPTSRGGRPFMSRGLREKQDQFGAILTAAIREDLR